MKSQLALTLSWQFYIQIHGELAMRRNGWWCETTMKYLRATLVIYFLTISISTFAGQAEYDDCILEHLKGAKLDIATDIINQACKENYKNPSFTSEKRRKYNHCLLENLVGVESFQAVIGIKEACGRKYK